MKMRIFLLFFLLGAAFPVCGQMTVVRVQDGKVYLDTSSVKTAVRPGDRFKVILAAEPLTNPTTGKDLGLIYTYSQPGTISEVQPLYAVGTLSQTAEVKVGQEAVWETNAETSAQSSVVSGPKEAAAAHTKVIYEPVEQEVISVSAADISAPGANEWITLSAKGQITVWKREKDKLVQTLLYQLPAAKKPLTLSAVAARGNVTAEIFATVYDERSARISTWVLAYENGQWNTVATLPYFVKEIGCGPNKTLWAQRPFVSGVQPGEAHPLVYQNGEFVMDKARRSDPRVWIAGLNFWPQESQEPASIYVASSGRVQWKPAKGKAIAYKELTVGTPNRVKYKQEIIKLPPSLQVVPSQGRWQAAVVENTAKFGLLSGMFGQYESAKVHFLDLDKGHLNRTDTVTLDGFVYDTTCTDRAVLMAEVLSDGQSSVVEILHN